MNQICNLILIKKQREGKIGYGAVLEEAFKIKMQRLVDSVVETSGATEDTAWELIQRLDSIEGITQEKIDRVCVGLHVFFRPIQYDFSTPRFIPAPSDDYQFSFLFSLGFPDMHL